jgi:hypothetical protein
MRKKNATFKGKQSQEPQPLSDVALEIQKNHGEGGVKPAGGGECV